MYMSVGVIVNNYYNYIDLFFHVHKYTNTM